MFHVALHELPFLYAAFTLGGVLLAAWLYNLARTRREERALRGRLQCRLCAFEFEDESGAILPRCPSCGALTERKTLSHL